MRLRLLAAIRISGAGGRRLVSIQAGASQPPGPLSVNAGRARLRRQDTRAALRSPPPGVRLARARGGDSDLDNAAANDWVADNASQRAKSPARVSARPTTSRRGLGRGRRVRVEPRALGSSRVPR